MLILLGLALSHAVLGAQPEPPSCPQGDVGGPLQDLEAGDASLTLNVDGDGVGHLHLRLPWTNKSAGPGSAAVRLSAYSGFAVRSAHVAGGKEAAFVEASTADSSWSAFLDALENGVAPDEVKAGGRRFGLHIHEEDDAVSVEVAAACSVRVVVVDVEALLDSAPLQGGWRFVVPAPFEKASLRVETPADHLVYVDGKRSTQGTRQASSATDDVSGFVVDVGRPGSLINARGGATSLVPKGASEKDTQTAAEPVSTQLFTLVRAAVDLPRPLAAAPPELHVVFVVDSSVSAGEQGVAMALAVVNAFLDEAPDDVGWALVTSSRTPHLLVPPWRSRQQRHLPTIGVENGSNIIAAVEMAQKIAADAIPGSGRVVVLSDLQVKDRDIDRVPLQISAGGPRGPLVHVVQLPADAADAPGIGFDRIFGVDDVRAYAAERSGGVLLNTWQDGDPRELGRHLVRPTRLDQPVILLDGHDIQSIATTSMIRVFDGVGAEGNEGSALPDLLSEGGGLRGSFIVPAGRGAGLNGLLWATPVEIPLGSTGAGRALDLAVMANGDLREVLDDDQVRAAAHAGHFVSRVTSLIDVPRWRPAQPDGGGAHGCGCCGSSSFTCCGGCHMVGRGSGIAAVVQPQEILDAIAAEAAEHCQVKKVAVDVEFGDEEILELKVDGGNACVAAYFWLQRLDQRANDSSFEGHETRRAVFEAEAAAHP